MSLSIISALTRRLPPPLVYAATFAAGLLLQRQATGAYLGAPGPWRAAGLAITILGLAVMFSGALTILFHRTTIIPHRRPTVLVSAGPYRLTRNPMYVGITIVYLGATLWTAAWWAAPLMALPVLFVDRVVIPMEESHLGERFGEPYEAYRRRVRRWI